MALSFGGQDAELIHPFQSAQTQLGLSNEAGVLSKLLTLHDQDTPFLQRRFTGEPGTPTFKETTRLDPADQTNLDATRRIDRGLFGTAEDWLSPQVERAFRNPINFSKLPQLTEFGAMGYPEPGEAPYANAMGAFEGLADSYLDPITPEQQAYKTARDAFRDEEMAFHETEAERMDNYDLPGRIPVTVLHEYYGTFNPDKTKGSGDLGRWMAEHGITPDEDGTISYDDLVKYAAKGFSGATKRSTGNLVNMLPYVDRWRETNRTPSSEIPAPERPEFPDATWPGAQPVNYGYNLLGQLLAQQGGAF